MIISPSVASCNLLKIGDEIDFAVKYFDDLHLDIEDGVATPGISFGMKLCNLIYETYGDIHRSVHVEYMNPVKWLDKIVALKPDICHIQIDQIEDEYKLETMKKFAEAGLKTGISLSTRDMERLEDDVYKECIEFADSILFCTNIIGDPKASFTMEIFDKAIELANRYNKKLWLDGGVQWEMFEWLKDYPQVEAVVMGRGIYKDKEYSLQMAKKYGELKKEVQD